MAAAKYGGPTGSEGIPRQVAFTSKDIKEAEEEYEGLMHPANRGESIYDQDPPLGFDWKALDAQNEQGAIHFPDTISTDMQKSSLANKPLALFNLQYWPRLDPNVHEAMIPAFRLASKWLTHRAAADVRKFLIRPSLF